MAVYGGAGGIRTLDRALQPYNGLANRRLQPLGHSSIEADMPDAGASRKRQIPGCLIQEPSSDTWTPDRGSPLYPEAGATHCYTRVANASRMRQCEPQEFFHGDLLSFRGCGGACNRNSRNENVGPIRKPSLR